MEFWLEQLSLLSAWNMAAAFAVFSAALPLIPDNRDGKKQK
jgi:hypothetical protein